MNESRDVGQRRVVDTGGNGLWWGGAGRVGQIGAKNRAAVLATAEELLVVESLDAAAIKTVIAGAALM